MTKLPAIPTMSHSDATLNFQKIQRELTEFRGSVAIAYRAAAQKLPKGEAGRVKVDTVTKQGKAGLIDATNGWYVVPSEGYYSAYGTVTLSVAKENLYWSAIYVNEVQQILGNQTVGFTGGESSPTATADGIVFCKAGDHIELWAGNSVAEPKLEGLGLFGNRLSVIRVA